MVTDFYYDDVNKDIEKVKAKLEIVELKNNLRNYLNSSYTKGELYRFKYYLILVPVFNFLKDNYKFYIEIKEKFSYFPLSLQDEIEKDDIKQLLDRLKTETLFSSLTEIGTVLKNICPNLDIPTEWSLENIGISLNNDFEIDVYEWSEEISQFKTNILCLVEEHFKKIEVQLEEALNIARNKRTLPEFAYYTALKWAFKKEKDLSFFGYMSLLDMPIKGFVSDKELYERLKAISDLLLKGGNVSASLNYSSGVSVGRLLDWAITELAKVQYDIEEL